MYVIVCILLLYDFVTTRKSCCKFFTYLQKFGLITLGSSAGVGKLWLIAHKNVKDPKEITVPES